MEPNISKCTGITILVTLEAFVGVLYASFCAAVIFTKLGRIQSFAKVVFSDPLVIRYGSGVAIEERTGHGDSDDGSSCRRGSNLHPSLRSFPCPVLEFPIYQALCGKTKKRPELAFCWRRRTKKQVPVAT